MQGKSQIKTSTEQTLVALMARTDDQVCHEFSVNKVEQNFEQYVCSHVISRIRPTLPISRILG